ncbi:L-2-amino-thiazoline-4-carboxylic acid hydrolase [Bacillus songklensis]|uniref:L-2-amino-thiazoline-4-carboxylic acid hydrolase n=1 Tax=Bacillus songklensis TaxID=1069116 RepID=A0ABV8B677_9BACI
MMKKFIEKQYFKGLSKKVDGDIVQEIQQRYKIILQENQSWIVDKPTELNIIFTSMVLSTFQTLKDRSIKDWESIIRYSLVEHSQEKQRFFMKLFLRLDPTPFKRIVNISKWKQVNHYGDQHFQYDILTDTDRNYHFHIKKCFFFDFFRSHDALEMMPLFCSLDNIWGDLLKNPKYGVRFERPQLLSKGDPHCSFQFENLRHKSLH